MPDRQRKRMVLTAAICAATVAIMTGMAFAAIPLYDLFCRVTGYNGTTGVAVAPSSQILQRRVEVRFDTNVAPGLPIEFTADQMSQNLRLGETSVAFFRVRNLSDQPVHAVASYNVAPDKVGRFFQKLECFCFRPRALAPGETADLPVVFFVDPALATNPDSEEVQQITLSYTYYREQNPAP